MATSHHDEIISNHRCSFEAEKRINFHKAVQFPKGEPGFFSLKVFKLMSSYSPQLQNIFSFVDFVPTLGIICII